MQYRRADLSGALNLVQDAWRRPFRMQTDDFPALARALLEDLAESGDLIGERRAMVRRTVKSTLTIEEEP
jgi:hypothetical protein